MANTVRKGDAFEKRAFDLLKRLIENEEFFVPGKSSKVFWKKGYYSAIREGEIIFDISIETYINNASKYSLLTIVECKDLNNKVSVDDIEEFESKLRRVGEHNIKGVFITNKGFQKGAYKTASNLGISLIRLASNNEYEWINYRKPKFVQPISKEELSAFFEVEKLQDRNLVASINGRPLYNVSDVLIELKIIDFYQHKERFINIPFVSEERIGQIIERLEKKGVYESGRLNMEKLCNVLTEAYQMSFDFDTELKEGILGKIEFDPLKISVTKSLKADLNRWRFTVSHEIGHLVLHNSLLKFSQSEKTDTSATLALESSIADDTVRRLEFQANLFARHLLLPTEPLAKAVAKYFRDENIQKGFLYLDNQPRNRELVFTLLNRISNQFQVSVEAAKVRLKAVELLKDATDNSMFSIMRNMGLK